jgi:hypothetical protein
MFRPYTLLPSPVTASRLRHGLSIDEAGDRLGIAGGYVEFLEAETKRISKTVLRMIEEKFAPPRVGTYQMTIFDALDALDGRSQGEGCQRG